MIRYTSTEYVLLYGSIACFILLTRRSMTILQRKACNATHMLYLNIKSRHLFKAKILPTRLPVYLLVHSTRDIQRKHG